MLKSTGPQSPVLLPLSGPRTPPDTPSQPIVSQRDPLGLMDPPRIPSPRTERLIEKRAFIRNEFRPATREWEEAAMLPVAKPTQSATEFDCYRRSMPRPREWYYPETTTVGRALPWQDRPWELQHERNVPLRRLPSKEAKAPLSTKSRMREGQVQLRKESDWDNQAMDFDCYAAHFALSS